MKHAITWILFVGVIGYLVWSVAFESRYRNRSSKETLLEIYHRLNLGDPKVRVHDLYNEFKTDRTQFNHSMEPWSIGMPYELGSGDWILYLQFDSEEGGLTSVAFRSSDGMVRKPNQCPDDKGEFKIER